jgi:hypothetical protein
MFDIRDKPCSQIDKGERPPISLHQDPHSTKPHFAPTNNSKISEGLAKKGQLNARFRDDAHDEFLSSNPIYPSMYP